MVYHYTSLFSPSLQYGILVLGLTYETHISPLFLLKRVVRVIAFEHFAAPSIPIFSDLEMVKLHDLYQLKLLSFVHDSSNKIFPSYFNPFFELVDSVHQCSTGQANN